MSVEKVTDIGGFEYLRKEGIGFTACVTEVLKAIPTVEAKGIYIHMLSKPDNWRFHRSVLCKELSIGKDKLATHLKHLINLGLVREQERRNQQGQFEGTDLFVNLGITIQINVESPQADYPAPVKPASGKSATTKLKTSTKQKINKNIGHLDNGQDTDKLFEEFWKSYPKKVKKPRALKEWLKIKGWEYADDIRSNIEQRTKCQKNWVKCKHQDKQFIPHPDQYLKNRQWEDSLETSHIGCPCQKNKSIQYQII